MVPLQARLKVYLRQASERGRVLSSLEHSKDVLMVLPDC
jgi:hypothetical protein